MDGNTRVTRSRRGMFALAAVAVALTSMVLPSGPVGAAVAPAAAVTWGGNGFGQLGSGNTATRLAPGPVVGGLQFVDLHGGREHVVALTAAGTVYTWGSNVDGQIGTGDTANRTAPVQVPGLTSVVAVETGHNYSVALRSDGSVWAWGLNSDGQLGDGTRTMRRSPVRVVGLTDAVGIAAGRDMTYALRSNGQLVAWGRNVEGQLGDGTTTMRLAPVRVGTLTGVVGMAGGRDHGLAVRSDGSVYAWGWNAYGQLGDGTRTTRTTPVLITTGIAEVAAGAHHSYARTTTGTVVSWGRNYRSELGDGTSTDRLRPVPVLGVSNAVTLGSGRDFGIVTRSDGRVQTWGHNASGQLGDGTTTDRQSAVFVPGINNAAFAGGGGSGFAVILVGSGTPPPNQPPVPRITSSCTGSTCSFSGSTSTDDGAIISYAWTLGDGTTATGVSASRTYAPGTYTVGLTVTDNNNVSATATTTFTVAEPPPNQPPVARITSSCTGLTCEFDGSTSTDDGSITTYAWDLGDGTTASGMSASRTYAPGTYTVTLTVTDNNSLGGSATTSVTVTQPPASTVAFRAAASSDLNSAAPRVTVPATVQTGDRLVLFATTNSNTTATTPTGWTLVATVNDGADMRSWVFTRSAVAGTAGSTVTLPLGATAKTGMSVVAYSGGGAVTAVGLVEGTTSTAVHTAPATTAPAGATIVRAWADKTSTVHGWTLPAGVTARTTSVGSPSGLVSVAVGDTASFAGGSVPAVTATAGVASAKALAWTVVVAPA